MYDSFPISVAMNAETLRLLEDLARQRQTNRSRLVRELIAAAAKAQAPTRPNGDKPAEVAEVRA